jgi:hypothetical protein
MTKSLLQIMLHDSMVLVLLKCLWEIGRLNRSFVQENSAMQYHQFKQLCQRTLWEDLTVCLHYSDDWECKDDLDDIYDDPKVEADASMASHRVKHGILEDGHNRRCQAIINPGKWITTDESRVAGWYHSVMMTIGPEPKPIRTGATLHTVCITNGPLSTYKLFARVYGGKSDQDINKHNKNTL